MRGRVSRPKAYLAPYITGHFCFEPVRQWIGKDYWNNEIGRGSTRAECEKICRQAGYVPVRDL